ncbi:bifunctional molybdenum cofactor biosynthesis protein MoaC/MoaB [Sediminitomix flava]|uniref:Molybdopterin adenylyltransferase n=1 Tax=Sediminitomix flava TaxID=379075 RepID=A0A315ZGP0_SEDFL|nr:bifunctional molybdenum cofactor biosynthesis protein MoaC/MoaB [Sediminitomix flava]PWJ44329.1 cyclic pyranopterin monophosphate synthase subunit MoaC [Sediminitomix flava]
MVDITHKNTSKRTALAEATVVVSKQETIDAIKNRTVPKGDVLEMAKTAGLFAVKRTSDVIPDCHPLPVEYTGVDYEIEGLFVRILITVQTVYKTGVEVEAMHGASVIALTMYDMLKPIDKQVEIQNIRLVKKKGGKSDFKDKFDRTLKAAVIVCSDSISAGKKEDKAGKAICEKLHSLEVETPIYEIIPDEKDLIKEKTLSYSKDGFDLVIFTGGTGLSPRDVSPEAIEPLLERRIPGMEEAIRSYGQERMPYAMLSRSLVGTIGDTLVMALPGSTNGAKESMDAVFPAALHVFRIFKGAQHDKIS